MNIAIMGETRLPVLPYGSGGLGRTTHDIASGLMALGHDVTLFAMPESEFPKIEHIVDPALYDVYIDFSHDHTWKYENTLHIIGDKECQYQPSCAVVQSHYMKEFYPTAKVIPAGVNVDLIPFSETHGDYLVFAGANFYHKQPHIAQQVARLSGKKLRMLGPDWERVDETQKMEIIGNAIGLLCPYTIDAAPRLPLEAAACGTPTLCLDGDGTKEHVLDGITGFICHDKNDMVSCVQGLDGLDRLEIRSWVAEKHNNTNVIPMIEGLLKSVVDGERW